MSERDDRTTALQSVIDRMRAGDAKASDELISHSCERLRRLTRKMLRQNPAVRRWAETDDVAQNAALRLMRALKAVTPPDVGAYFGLAAVQIRRELIDLARHFYGPQGDGAHHASDPGGADPLGERAPRHDPADSTAGPATLAQWAEFHEHVSSLPEEERQVFDLIFYQGLAQADVVKLTGTSERTVKRRWRSARLLLANATRGTFPEP